MSRITFLYFALLLPFKASSSSLRLRDQNVKHEGKSSKAVMARMAAIESRFTAFGTEAAAAKKKTEAEEAAAEAATAAQVSTTDEKAAVAESEGKAGSAKAPAGAQEKNPAAADAAENKKYEEVNATNEAEAVSKQQHEAETAAKAEAVAAEARLPFPNHLAEQGTVVRKAAMIEETQQQPNMSARKEENQKNYAAINYPGEHAVFGGKVANQDTAIRALQASKEVIDAMDVILITSKEEQENKQDTAVEIKTQALEDINKENQDNNDISVYMEQAFRILAHELDHAEWKQVGDDIDGAAVFDYSGYSVAFRLQRLRS
jgi:hypothetical protein